jgi:sterol desaturase/sphingolipid hydroxylase (fatty acid hydroxylase superfamily)
VFDQCLAASWQPFDDLYIHPVEAVGYYMILYSPPLLLPIHKWGFALYMAIMGLCGVLDHSGIRVVVPGFYDTADHDLHHR